MRWHVVVEATNRSTVEAVISSLPADCRITIFADERSILRVGRSIGGFNVNYVNSVINAMSTVQDFGDDFVLHVPSWSSVDRSVFEEAEKANSFKVMVLWVVDKSGRRQRTEDWRTMGTAVFGRGSHGFVASKGFVTTGASVSEIQKSHTTPNLGPEPGSFPFSDVAAEPRYKVLDPSSFIDTVLLRSTSVRQKPWSHAGEYDLGTQGDNEVAVRDAKGHWIFVHFGDGPWSWREVISAAYARSDRDLIVFPGLLAVNPGSVRRLPPVGPDPSAWASEIIEMGARVSILDASGSSIAEHGVVVQKKPTRRRLRVAVMSMCGVTSLEDRYGLGGEHQVVHWLREGFERHPDVEHCDIFDTANSELAQPDYYDLVLSNSCWKEPPTIKKGGTSIFWHFNTNAFNGTVDTVVKLGYTHVWTNSPSSLAAFRAMGVPAAMKHLNASTIHHLPYRWNSTLFRHDCCYIGGYQTEYKGKELIDEYVKVLCGRDDFDFAIYGNRKWLSSVQQEALKLDSGFKREHYDESFDKYYKQVLSPDDFPILARNCKVWVNFNALDQRPLGMVNDRPIWAMACSAFVITDDTPEQRALYGDTCDYSTGGADLLEKVRYWIPREKQRLEMGVAAAENIAKRKLHTQATADAAVRLHLEGEQPDDSPV